jgi:hypothetical protein
LPTRTAREKPTMGSYGEVPAMFVRFMVVLMLVRFEVDLQLAEENVGDRYS